MEINPEKFIISIRLMAMASSTIADDAADGFTGIQKELNSLLFSSRERGDVVTQEQEEESSSDLSQFLALNVDKYITEINNADFSYMKRLLFAINRIGIASFDEFVKSDEITKFFDSVQCKLEAGMYKFESVRVLLKKYPDAGTLKKHLKIHEMFGDGKQVNNEMNRKLSNLNCNNRRKIEGRVQSLKHMTIVTITEVAKSTIYIDLINSLQDSFDCCEDGSKHFDGMLLALFVLAEGAVKTLSVAEKTQKHNFYTEPNYEKTSTEGSDTDVKSINSSISTMEDITNKETSSDTSLVPEITTVSNLHVTIGKRCSDNTYESTTNKNTKTSVNSYTEEAPRRSLRIQKPVTQNLIDDTKHKPEKRKSGSNTHKAHRPFNDINPTPPLSAAMLTKYAKYLDILRTSGRTESANFKVYIDGCLLRREAGISNSVYKAMAMEWFVSKKYLSICAVSGDLIDDNFANCMREFQTLAEQHKPSLAAIINACITDRHNLQLNAFDNKRTACSVSLSADSMLYQFVLQCMHNFKCLCLIDPHSLFVNAQGEMGCEVMEKGWGVGSQIAHKDVSQPHGQQYTSYFASITDQYAAAMYNPVSGDGACSIFINPYPDDDYIGVPGGPPVPLPAYSVSLFAGDFYHYGLENYHNISGVLKIFGHCDGPGYNRVNRVSVQDKVSPYIHHDITIRETTAPYRPVSIRPLKTYSCHGGCVFDDRDAQYYFYPYCKACLLHTCEVKLSCKKYTPTAVKGSLQVPLAVFNLAYTGNVAIESDAALNIIIKGDVVTKQQYMMLHPEMNREMLDIVHLDDVYHLGEQMYLDCSTSLRSLVASMQQSHKFDECNVMLSYDIMQSFGKLYALRVIRRGDILVLYNRAKTLWSKRLCVAYNHNAAIAANEVVVKETA